MAWKLINDTTGEAHALGDVVVSFRGETYTLVGMTPPHKPASSGFVNVSLPGSKPDDCSQYYPSVFGATFVRDAVLGPRSCSGHDWQPDTKCDLVDVCSKCGDQRA